MKPTDLLSQADKLPNVPEVVRELIMALDNPNAKYREIAAKVAKDQTLSLKVLRVVNSAYFGLSRKVISIDDAVILLGMDRLKTLVIASGFAGSVSDVEGINLKKFWAETFRIAEMAKWLAKHSPFVEADTAFATGVVHNIGRLLLHLAEPNRAKAVQQLIQEKNVSRTDAEIERFGFTSQDAGRELLLKWHFPTEVCDAIIQYRKPLTGDVNHLAQILHLAAYLNACVRDGRSKEEIVSHFPMQVAMAAEVEMDVINELDAIIAHGQDLESLVA